jgi:predicted O-methyltransferase YrrM
MKELIKSVLPESIVHAMIEMRDAVRLAAAPRLDFNPASLPVRGFDLGSIFEGSGFGQAWEADHTAITGLFGDDNRLGGVNPGDRRALYYLIRALAPQTVLEVGTHIGASTLYIARALKANGAGGIVTTVDIVDVNSRSGPWVAAGLSMTPEAFAGSLECRDLVDYVAAPSLSFMRETTRRFDFIFLDGDHAGPTVYTELSAALGILNSGGAILLHDFYPRGEPLFPTGKIIRGPFRALVRIGRECPEIAVQPLGNLPWTTKQGVNATSLALVTRAARTR